jgi:hypothetical protein
VLLSRLHSSRLSGVESTSLQLSELSRPPHEDQRSERTGRSGTARDRQTRTLVVLGVTKLGEALAKIAEQPLNFNFVGPQGRPLLMLLIDLWRKSVRHMI